MLIEIKKGQFRKISRLIKQKCCNCVDGNCLLLDDGETHKEQTDSVHLSASEYHISVGQTITVTLYGTSKVTWSVSNSNPVTVTSNKNEAKVKARRKGNTQLYAKDNATGKVYICDIYVG